ncbi:MAG: DEAD/DEAH box helicase [Treponema sp.]|nr:DEAD/DEAH box helicase [Treponema sp.]
MAVKDNTEKGESTSFEALGVLPFFIERLKERGINAPLEIQKDVIPLFLNNEKILFRSPTGTGKTYAYLLPLLGKFLPLPGKLEDNTERRGPRLLIAAPTYELCSQIKAEADFLLKGTELRTTLLIGQANLTRQIDDLRKNPPDIILGNPGRLLLLAHKEKLKLRNLRYVILDEGDRLVSDELMEETGELVNIIRQKTGPEKAGQLLFAALSATFSAKSTERLLSLMGEGVKDISSGGNILRDQVEHWAIYCEEREKLDTLRSLVAALDPKRRKTSFKALIFTSRGSEVGKIVSLLQRRGLSAGGLMGDMKNQARKQSLDDFRGGRIKLLVTSDLAARGLDIPDLSHIIALDLQENPDSYIHRAGRTARAGKRGIMVTIGDKKEMLRLAALEKRLKIIVNPKELFGGRVLAVNN